MKTSLIMIILFAVVAALVQAAPQSQKLSDPRHQQRNEAANVLQAAIREPKDASSSEATLDRYRGAVRRAIEIVGAKSQVGRHLAATLRTMEAPKKGAPSEETIHTLRSRLDRIRQNLAFAPTMEADLPKGFPPPTPIGEMEVKAYPAYRMARTELQRSSAFWTLFSHIKENNIAMTAPVEMDYRLPDEGQARQESMAFLYASPDLGTAGANGSVRVVDVSPQLVASIGVRGETTPEKIAAAQKRILEWLQNDAKGYKADGGTRVMGYNSPFIPQERKYFEVQVRVAKDDHLGSK
ncbi:MAG: heme-binding protein [Pirellulales bacterium]|nr:heme-binding protein [Pirellulales bacterium]